MFYIYGGEIFYYNGETFFDTEIDGEVLTVLEPTSKEVVKERSATPYELQASCGVTTIVKGRKKVEQRRTTTKRSDTRL